MAEINMDEVMAPTLRAMPVLLLLDTSGSMTNEGRINSLNRAVKEMIDTFKNCESMSAEIYVSIITFGGDEAEMHTPLKPAKDVVWKDMIADGLTPLGSAVTMAKELICDANAFPKNSFRPTVILASDGRPNDKWIDAMKDFTSSKRTGSCDRFSMAMGVKADREMLKSFVSDGDKRFFEAKDAQEIIEFIDFVSRSITVKSTSNNPQAKLKVPGNLNDLVKKASNGEVDLYEYL